MLKSERQNLIFQYLKTKGTVRVINLATDLHVNPVTIRRDLAEMESTGYLRRVHGGAVLRDEKPLTPLPSGVEGRIAEAAARFVPNKSVIFLGPGPLTSEVVPFLRTHEHLTIITNALNVGWRVAQQHQSHPLHLLGGQVEQDWGIYGDSSDALRNIRVDWTILEAGGLDAERGVTHDDRNYANMARALFALSAQVIVLIAPENLGRTGALFIASASEVDILITGREAPTPPLWDLSELGMRIVLA